MIKANGTIQAARLNSEVVKTQEGDGHVETYWLVTLKIHADKCFANALAQYTEELVAIQVEPVQHGLGV